MAQVDGNGDGGGGAEEEEENDLGDDELRR